MQPTSTPHPRAPRQRRCRAVRRPVPALLLLTAALAAPAYAVENSRLINFDGQTPAAAMTGADGQMTIEPLNGSITMGPNRTYGIGTPGYPTGTTFTVTPAPNATPYRLDVTDQRTTSVTWVSATCMNPSTLALEPCDLSNAALFPRASNPIGGGAYWQISEFFWDSATQELAIYTPGATNQNIQSNGMNILLPPYVREIKFRTTNFGAADSIFGFVYVADAPSVSKSFAPATVQPGGQSTLTINLHNPDLGAPVPGTHVLDQLPAPLQVVSATHTCTGGTLTAPAGGSTIELTGASIPVGDCQITAQVSWPGTASGITACTATPTVTNTITPGTSFGDGQFSTAAGQMATPAEATLSCNAPPPPVDPPVKPTAVPTLDEWGRLLLSALMAVTGLLLFARSRRA